MEQERVSVFIDASVLFSACASATGASREIIRYALRNQVDVVISELALQEVERNLAAKRPQALPFFEILQEAIPFEIVEPTKSEVLQMQPYIAFKDAPILAAAKKAAVYCLVTLDRRHMIAERNTIEQRTGVKILLPSECLEFLRQQMAD